MSWCITSVFLTLYFVTISETARILAVFPTPSISHQVVFRPLTQELARRGHEVVVITTDPAFPKGEAPANLTEIDVHYSYDIWGRNLAKHVTGKGNEVFGQFETLYHLINVVTEQHFQDPEILKLIHSKQTFDLLLLESWVRPILIYGHFFKAPIVQMSSFGRLVFNYEDIGAPVHPLLYPRIGRQRLYNLNMWEKIQELYNEYMLVSIVKSQEVKDNEMLIRNFGPEIPRLDELANNIDLLMLNMHIIWEDNHPVPPGVIHMWGMHKSPDKPLPESLKTVLDSSNHGVIYMSFGTNTQPSNLDPEMINTFIKVFSKLPYDVLWKWDKDELPGIPKNIRIAKWFPQSDLLKHPKIKLFITQGGLQSTDEAITAEVPLIGIPMLGDQWYNVEKYVRHGIGIKILPELITVEGLTKAIETIIDDKSYRQNVKKLKILMNDQPMPALERAVWWTEYVLRHGGARHLRAPAANISWAHYLELELILKLLMTMIIFFALVVSFTLVTYKYISKFMNVRLKIKRN